MDTLKHNFPTRYVLPGICSLRDLVVITFVCSPVIDGRMYVDGCIFMVAYFYGCSIGLGSQPPVSSTVGRLELPAFGLSPSTITSTPSSPGLMVSSGSASVAEGSTGRVPSE